MLLKLYLTITLAYASKTFTYAIIVCDIKQLLLTRLWNNNSSSRRDCPENTQFHCKGKYLCTAYWFRFISFVPLKSNRFTCLGEFKLVKQDVICSILSTLAKQDSILWLASYKRFNTSANELKAINEYPFTYLSKELLVF